MYRFQTGFLSSFEFTVIVGLTHVADLLIRVRNTMILKFSIWTLRLGLEIPPNYPSFEVFVRFEFKWTKSGVLEAQLYAKYKI